jgi:hypothetical protein
MERLNKTISEFVAGFEAKFNHALLPAGRLGGVEGKSPPISTNHFGICIAETKFSDWDLHCYANPEKIALPDLTSMDEFVKEFPGFEGTKNFTGNSMPQFMAFMPTEFAPFVDLHIEGVPQAMTDQYFSRFDAATLQETTNAWLLLTWWRKLRKGNQTDLDTFRSAWITPARLGPEGHSGITNNPISFLVEYFKNRTDYAKAAEYLSQS